MATADLKVIGLVGSPDAGASAYIAEIQRRLAAHEQQTLDNGLESVRRLLD